MNEQQYLAKAAELLKVKPEQIIQYKLADDKMTVLIDEGIGGIKKLSIPLATLDDKKAEALAVEEAIEAEAQKVDAVRDRLVKRGRK